MNKKDFMSLTIKDSFMFYAVMMDPEQCKRLLTLVLEMEIEEVTVHREDVIMYHPDYHGIRLDVIANEKGTRRRFNVEMQARKKKGLVKRTRYYHSQLDSDALLTSQGYDELPDTYVIFICDFDPIGAGLYRYCYEMQCEETGALLNDGRHTILLSTKGKDKSTVPPELVSFLEYVGDPTSMEASDDSFVQSLKNQIAAIKKNREWRDQYMQLELLIAEERAEARAEGLKEGHAEGREEGRTEGRAEGRVEGLAEGHAEGDMFRVIHQCCRKLARGKSVEEIADELESDISEISAIVAAAQGFAPEYDVEKIYRELQKQ